MNFYSGIYGIKVDERDKICDELLELVNLKDKKIPMLMIFREE